MKDTEIGILMSAPFKLFCTGLPRMARQSCGAGRINTCQPRRHVQCNLAIETGQVGDVVEFSHMLTGLQYGTVKLTTRGITIDKPSYVTWE